MGFFMTIRFRSGHTCPLIRGMSVFVAIVNDWQLLTICTRNFIPCFAGVLDLQLKLLLLYTFYTYICIYMSLRNPPSTGDRFRVHKTFRRRSMTTYGRFVCFQHISCVVGIVILFLSYFYLFC